MEKKTAELIGEAAEMIGLDVEVRDDYSGRGMYGDTCSGIVGDIGDVMACVAQAAADLQEQEDMDQDVDFGVEDFVCDLQTIRTDSMGRSVIYY